MIWLNHPSLLWCNIQWRRAVSIANFYTCAFASNLATLKPNNTCFAPSLVKEEVVGMWKTCLLGLPFGLFSCVLLVYLTLGSNPYVIVLKIKNATSQSNLSNFSVHSHSNLIQLNKEGWGGEGVKSIFGPFLSS